MTKAELRQFIRRQKQQLSPGQIAQASHALLQQLKAHPLYREAASLYVYLSYNQEVLTAPIIRQAWQDGKRIAVPKVFGEEMRFLWLTAKSRVVSGYRGVPEPAEGMLATDPTALVLLPGLAFDRQGHRIGYGGGFYDRFLAAEPHPTLALCFDFQLFPLLPFEAHDIPADAVLSASTER